MATGALLIDHVDSIEESTMGKFESMTVETFDSAEGLRDRLYLNVGEDSGLTTIDVSGGGGAPVEFIRGLYDANSVAKPLNQDHYHEEIP